MSSRSATLVDLGLDLVDSDLEDAHEMDIQYTDSDSHDECSSSDEELEGPEVELATEVVSSPARSVVETSRPTDFVGCDADRPLLALGSDRPTSDVWSRLGPRAPHDRNVSRASVRSRVSRAGPYIRRANNPHVAQAKTHTSDRRPAKLYHRYTRDRARRSEPKTWNDGRTRHNRWDSRPDTSRHPRRCLAPHSLTTLRGKTTTRRLKDTKPSSYPLQDKISPDVITALRSIKNRASVENIQESYVKSSEVMFRPFGGMMFPADSNPWAPVLSVMATGQPSLQNNPWLVGTPHTPIDAYGPKTHCAPWDDVLRHGPVLYKTFQTNPRTASTAKILREIVLRRESLIAALASADELFTWCKMCIAHNLPLRSEDPIISTSGAILENLLLQLRPFLPCYLRARKTKPLDELCNRAQLSDVQEIVSLTFILLARLSSRVRDSDGLLDYGVLGVDGDNQMDYYIPGSCLTGVLEILATHRNECVSRICELVASQLVSPNYVHGKYFYCNSLY
ncbi:multifunctional expression regulator ICP27 [Macropodid alphaherpesvirus 1]|uniref:Multifunctional expression regulator ICP27 n=1 Tax=Macropodid alphaherpesvirus 1 TaxID=137443 RepID=A0A120HUI5_9ALPH|nr:multifunctional expression regulator ICP27 [Macropodid alphaherpesvirus 1]AMB17020.1 multifunctional expression regulator ICP27 [Macropodid alphaherpesvirus 1]